MSELALTASLDLDAAELARFLGLPDPGFFDYEYRRMWPDKAVFVTARADGCLVGTQALMAYPLKVGGKLMMTGRSERTLTAQSQRGGGLFPRLMETCAARGAEHGLEFIWGTTTAKVPFQRNGYLFIDRFLEHALWCIRPEGVPGNLAAPQDARFRTAKAAAALPSLALGATAWLARATDVEVRSRPLAEGDVDELYEALRQDAPLIVMHQDDRFVRWMLDDGHREVARHYAYRGGKLVAYAYADVTRADTASLLDFAALDAPSLHGLLRAVRRDLLARGTVFVHTSYNHKNPLLARMRRWLVRAGFVPVFRGGGLVVRPLRFHDFNYLADISRWYVTGMWSMLYRPPTT